MHVKVTVLHVILTKVHVFSGSIHFSRDCFWHQLHQSTWHLIRLRRMRLTVSRDHNIVLCKLLDLAICGKA